MLRDKIISKLKKRKEELLIPYDAIAKRAGIGVATVKRVFDGQDVSIGKIEHIAEVLGLDDELRPKYSASKMLNVEVNKKTEALLMRIEHTARLELQSPSTKASISIKKEIRKKLLSMPRSKIWL